MSNHSATMAAGQLEAAERLGEWMAVARYPQATITAVTTIVASTGAVCDAVGPGLLLAYDEAKATEVFVDALEPVSYDDPAWGGDEDLDDVEAVSMLPPIAGGDGFEPTADDLDWWAAQLECREAHEWWESLPTDPFGDCAAPSSSMD